VESWKLAIRNRHIVDVTFADTNDALGQTRLTQLLFGHGSIAPCDWTPLAAMLISDSNALDCCRLGKTDQTRAIGHTPKSRKACFDGCKGIETSSVFFWN